jgi:hypothetical protein
LGGVVPWLIATPPIQKENMKIKKSRWHYKLLDWFTEGRVPTNLCSYFWNLVGRLFFLLLLTGIASGVIYEAIKNWQTTLLAIGVIGGVVLGGIGIAVFAEWNEKRKKSDPGLVMSFLKAKKDKVCPLLEFE